MKKRILALGLAVMLAFSGMTAYASEDGVKDSVDISGMLDEVKDKISGALEKVDEGTAREMFSFVKEKISGGALKTEEGLEQAIEEGESKFGVTIDKADAKRVVDTMEKLEDMGFSGEYVIEKAQSLYEEYGADFVEHADEVISGAVKNAVSTAVNSFFKNLWESAKGFFDNLFGGK